MKICRKKIAEVAKALDNNLDIIEMSQDYYQIASIFSPVENGFYFTTGVVPDWAKPNSDLFVLNRSVFDSLAGKESPGLLLTTKDPQYLYYAILERCFASKSTGEISPLSVISPTAHIGENVEIGPFCVVKDGVSIGANTQVGTHCVLEENVRIGENTQLDAACHIGAPGVAWVWSEDGKARVSQPQMGGVIIGDSCFIGSNTVIVRGSLNESTEIFSGVVVAPGCRIGHGSSIGRQAHLANGVLLAGNVKLGERCFVGSGAVFRPRVQVHDNCVVAAGAVVVRDTIQGNVLLIGVPALEETMKKQLHGVPRASDYQTGK